MIDFIYHYTNAQGLLGIINKQEEKINLWFTHYKYLNDSSEGAELQRIYKIVIENMKADGEISETEYDSIKDLRFEDKHMYAYTTMDGEEPLTHIKHAEDNTYICCFSKNGDALNMWRYYSKQDTGYAIGLFGFVMEREARIDSFSPDETRIGKFAWEEVIYDDNVKKELIHASIIEAIKDTKRIEELIAQQGKEAPYTQSLCYAVHSALIPYKFYFKHSCFQSEEEVRCILTIPKDKKLTADKKSFKVSYRNRDGILTPYIVVPFSRKALCSITVSPTAPVEAYETMREYLRDYKDKVFVNRSELPIRF